MIEEAEEVLPDVMMTAEGMMIIVMAAAVVVVMAVESKKTGPVPQRFFAVETIGVIVVIDIV